MISVGRFEFGNLYFSVAIGTPPLATGGLARGRAKPPPLTQTRVDPEVSPKPTLESRGPLERKTKMMTLTRRVITGRKVPRHRDAAPRGPRSPPGPPVPAIFGFRAFSCLGFDPGDGLVSAEDRSVTMCPLWWGG